MSDGAPGLNAVLGQSGPCPEVTHAGKTWKIGHPTQAAKAILNHLVVANATAEIVALEKVLPAAVVARMFDAITTKIGARHYHTWHPGWLETMGGQDGDVLYLLSLLKMAHPEATEADARTLYWECSGQVKVALAQVMPPFFDLLERDFPPQIPLESRMELMAEMRTKAAERFQPPPAPTS